MREYRLVDFFYLSVLSLIYLFSNYPLDEAITFLFKALYKGKYINIIQLLQLGTNTNIP